MSGEDPKSSVSPEMSKEQEQSIATNTQSSSTANENETTLIKDAYFKYNYIAYDWIHSLPDYQVSFLHHRNMQLMTSKVPSKN
jgi:hypothetical protein